jgi:hypothetical protein
MAKITPEPAPGLIAMAAMRYHGHATGWMMLAGKLNTFNRLTKTSIELDDGKSYPLVPFDPDEQLRAPLNVVKQAEESQGETAVVWGDDGGGYFANHSNINGEGTAVIDADDPDAGGIIEGDGLDPGDDMPKRPFKIYDDIIPEIAGKPDYSVEWRTGRVGMREGVTGGSLPGVVARVLRRDFLAGFSMTARIQ